METAPSTTITIARTVAKIGRLMKNALKDHAPPARHWAAPSRTAASGWPQVFAPSDHNVMEAGKQTKKLEGCMKFTGHCRDIGQDVTCHGRPVRPLRVTFGLDILLELKDRLRPVPDWRQWREGGALLLGNRLQDPDPD